MAEDRENAGPSQSPGQPEKAPWVPPRWFVRSFWAVHRMVYKATGGRLGLRSPAPGRYGMLALTTVGRRTGKQRTVILAYFDDGPNLALMAMNGWSDSAPAWWLNLQAHPEASAHLPGKKLTVTARKASAAERSRLWPRIAGPQGDAYAALRTSETPVIILEPRPERA